MATLAILTAIAGLACYFTAREVQRTHGAEIAIFILMVLFLFTRAHSGISMSESLGVALGTLGFGLLWRGASIECILYLGGTAHNHTCFERTCGGIFHVTHSYPLGRMAFAGKQFNSLEGNLYQHKCCYIGIRF
jgi:hypothetical protein